MVGFPTIIFFFFVFKLTLVFISHLIWKFSALTVSSIIIKALYSVVAEIWHAPSAFHFAFMAAEAQKWKLEPHKQHFLQIWAWKIACLSIINSDAEREVALVWGIHKFQKTKLNPNGLSQLRDQLSCHLTCLCIGVTINDPKSLIFFIFFHFTFGRPGHHQCKTTTKHIYIY